MKEIRKYFGSLVIIGGLIASLNFGYAQMRLEPAGVSNGQAYLNLYNATNQVYAIWSTTNLLSNWNVETEMWPTNAAVMPFTVPTLERQSLFMRAEDWTGVAENGNTTPDWWFWEYFGTVALSDTNLDSQGNTLLYDYQNGLDPNVIQFSFQFANYYVNTGIAYGTIAVLSGVPSYEAVLINETNFADANWQPYNPTVVVPLNSGDGNYDVWVGLRGLPLDAQQTWQRTQLTLDTVAPTLTILNPVSSTVSQPVIQLQGYASEPLSSLTFDVSNATGVWTNQTGYVTGQFFDTNLFLCTTNYFQCPDVALGDGLNTITLYATDWAGNTTNISFTLEYSVNANAPALTVIWPPDGTYISGSQFTLQGQVDNATAKITASIVDASGNTNSIQGLVERSGLVWIQNLPLAAGANTLTVTATDEAGNTSTTSLTLYQSSVLVTMNPLSSDQLNQSSVTVTGLIGDPSCDVWINGIEAYYVDDAGDWEADGVPVSPTGTAIFDVEVYGGSSPNVVARAQTGLSLRANDLPSGTATGSEQFPQVQPPMVVTASYSEALHYTDTGGYVDQHYVANWVYNVGGNWVYWVQDVGNEWPFAHYNHSFSGTFSMDGTIMFQGSDAVENSFGPPWSYASYSGAAFSTAIYDNSTDAKVMIVPSGQQTSVGTNLYLVRACASEFSDPAASAFNGNVIQGGSSGNNGDVPLPPEWLQINKQTLVNSGITNDDGSVWGETIISAPAGKNVDVTPVATQVYQNWDYTFNVQAFDITPQLAVDANRDGNITFNAQDQASANNPYRFWINDSQESGDVTSGSDTVPGSSSPNYALNQVNGRCDLINFFPVALCLSNVLQWLPPANGWEYHLSQADSAVKFVYTSLMPTNAFDYLTNWDGYDDYGVNTDEWVTNADTIQVTNSQASGTILDTNWLAMVQNNGGNGVVLMEGCATSTAPLMLELWHKDQNGVDQKMGGVPLYISISGVEQMYRWINLRDSFAVSGETQPAINYPTRSGQPSNFPDSASDGRQVIYVHGFNVPEQKSRAEIAEAFKRLWQSHSKAMFTGVSWYGDQAYSGLLGTSLDYYSNVRNAFLTAPALANAVASLPGAHKVVIAHSLGNMVVSSAIVDCGMNVEKYCAIDAAVAMEAYDGSIKDLGMVNPDVGAGVTFQGWPNYDQRLWSTEWYQLFDASDGRSGLTWRDRFGVIPNLYNFYSSGEEVLENPPGYQQLPSLGKEWIWVTQEMRKGTGLFDLLGTLWLVDSHPEAGWALNNDWYILPSGAPPGGNTEARYPWQATTNDISDDALRADPFCRTFNDSNLTGAGGSAEATNIQVRAEMLGVGFPALSHAVGANSVGVFGTDHNFDLNSADPDNGFQTGWPASRASTYETRWLHSDLKDIAYPFNHKLHDKLVQLGGLNQ